MGEPRGRRRTPPERRPDGGADEGEMAERVVVLNPVSGGGGHRKRISRLAGEHGFAVRETEREGDARRLAREAAEAGATVIAAAGGDGTVNGVVHGIDEADALDRATLAVVPVGTGNNFAGNVGVRGVDHAFEVVEEGRTRRIDVGHGDGRLFVNSLVGGLTAEASGRTSSELKERFGVVAYVLTTLQTMREYEGFDLALESPDGGGALWEGDAVFVLVGNARRFGSERISQANAEDGLLDVTIIESMPPRKLIEQAAIYRLLGAESDYVARLKTASLRMNVRDGEPLRLSFDGEMASYRSLSVGVRPAALSVFVGEGYDPAPDEEP